MQFSSQGINERISTRYTRKKGYIKTSALILFAFCTAFYSRIFCTLTRAPSVLNFLHFITVPFALVVALATTKTKDRKQILTTWELIFGILALLGATLVSAVANNAGLINVIFNFLILGEPYLFLLAMICIPLSPTKVKQIRTWILVSALINFLLAEIQKPLLATGLLVAPNGMDETDGVQGVFFVTGAGGYVSTAISVSVSLYFFLYFKSVPIWMRILGLIGAVHQILIADTKQVLLTSGLAWLLLVLTKVHNIKKFLLYLITIVIAISVFIWASYNIEAFAVYGHWFGRSDINQDFENGGWAVKTKGISMVIAHYRSPLNWLFGLGPGHTLGRLGGWSIREYWNLLSPLGATAPPFYDEIWKFIRGNWIAWSTTLYVPLFSWAGIWGDLGWFGLGAYLYLGSIVWRRFCLDDFSRFLALTVLVYGFFLTQIEEPGYMLSIASLIALRWHQKRQL